MRYNISVVTGFGSTARETIHTEIHEHEMPSRRQLRKALAHNGVLQFTDVDGEQWAIGDVLNFRATPIMDEDPPLFDQYGRVDPHRRLA